MLSTPRSHRGMVSAPHHLASEAGLRVLRDGGNALEAALAAAATVAVVYPHMNSIGGDGFWLFCAPGEPPRAIDAAGTAGGRVDVEHFRRQGLSAIPFRGPQAACSLAGALSGWEQALGAARAWGGGLSLERLLEEAVHHAEAGFAVTRSQSLLTTAKLAELGPQPGFGEVYLNAGVAPRPGSLFKQPALAATLRRLAKAGPDDFYRGELARSVAADLAACGSPLVLADLQAYRAGFVEPLSVRFSAGRLYNLPPPTQGLASLIILALYDRLRPAAAEGFDFVHLLVEATKQAFLLRDREIADPGRLRAPPASFLEAEALDDLASRIDPARALQWPQPAAAGDTIWLGAVDSAGRAVSYIQSTYWEYGSGVVLPQSGIVWQNRGASFSLDPSHPRAAGPGRKPFHTLNPALALFDDGRVLSYGCMGGEGQPQTQAAVFARHALHGQELQAAVTAPRWLLGRTWGEESTSLKLEGRFPAELAAELAAAGHDVEVVTDFTDVMGHAGALLHHPDGLIEGASDPRSEGAVAAF